jgi:hypothetical protein
MLIHGIDNNAPMMHATKTCLCPDTNPQACAAAAQAAQGVERSATLKCRAACCLQALLMDPSTSTHKLFDLATYDLLWTCSGERMPRAGWQRCRWCAAATVAAPCCEAIMH